MWLLNSLFLKIARPKAPVPTRPLSMDMVIGKFILSSAPFLKMQKIKFLLNESCPSLCLLQCGSKVIYTTVGVGYIGTRYILPRIYQNDLNCNLMNEFVACCELTLSEWKLLYSLSILNVFFLQNRSNVRITIIARHKKNVKLSRWNQIGGQKIFSSFKLTYFWIV